MEFAHSGGCLLKGALFSFLFLGDSPHFLPYLIREMGASLYTWQSPWPRAFTLHIKHSHGTQYVYNKVYGDGGLVV